MKQDNGEYSIKENVSLFLNKISVFARIKVEKGATCNYTTETDYSNHTGSSLTSAANITLLIHSYSKFHEYSQVARKRLIDDLSYGPIGPASQ